MTGPLLLGLFTSLIATAHATWEWPVVGDDCPGFSAEAVVTLDGRTRFGRVIVGPGGDVRLEHLDAAAAAWAGAELRAMLKRQAPGPADARPSWESPRAVSETVTVRATATTAAGAVVPASFSVERRGRWDGALLAVEQRARSWASVGGHDLPARASRQVVGLGAAPSSGVLLLTGHRLLGPGRE